jgi:hypothetical protein
VIVCLGIVVAVGIHNFGRRDHTRRVWWCVNIAILTQLIAAVIYAWGRWKTFTLDARETCQLQYGEPWDGDYVAQHMDKLDRLSPSIVRATPP